MKKLKWLVIVCIVFVSGCALNPKITASNKEVSYHKKITSLAVIYIAKKLGTDESSIRRSQFNKLKAPFVNAGIKTNLFFYSGLDLQSRKHFYYYLNKDAYALIIDPVHMTTGDYVDITYNLSLYDVKHRRKIWVANLWVPTGWFKAIYQRYDEMGSLIVNRLKKDDLI